jgi:2'-5' RNA ligase
MVEKFLPEGTAKYFIAIIPPEPVYAEALACKQQFQTHFNSKAALKSPPHITLHMPFLWKTKKEEKLIEKLTSFAKDAPSFQIGLNGFGAFAPRVIFIQVNTNPYLVSLQSALHRFCKKELQLFNSEYKDLPFHPHLTVAFRDLKKDQFAKAWSEFEKKPFAYTFQCSSITLLKHDGKMWQAFHHFLLSNNQVISNLV